MDGTILAAILSVGVTVISAVILDGIHTRVLIGVIDDRVTDLRGAVKDIRDWQKDHDKYHLEQAQGGNNVRDRSKRRIVYVDDDDDVSGD
jgi:hypothetical protein